MLRQPQRSPLFPTRRSSDLTGRAAGQEQLVPADDGRTAADQREDRKSTRLNSSHVKISYAVFCLKKKNQSVMLKQPQLSARNHDEHLFDVLKHIERVEAQEV